MQNARRGASRWSLMLVGCFCSSLWATVPQASEPDAVDALLKPLAWRELGPTATGGRIVDLDAPADDPFTIYAASASGGLWRSVNNGTTWQCIFEREGTTSIGDIALDPNHPEVIWVGTGEANNQRSAFWGDGIYKSTDGGKTWTNMGLPDSHHIGRIVVDPNDSDVVYVAALGHLYTANEQRGLYKTTDGGKTWNRVLYVNPQVGIVDVALDPGDSRTLYAASYEKLRRAWDFDGAGPGSAIYKSTDGGETWNKLGGGLPEGDIGRIGIAISTVNPKRVYATVSNQNLRTAESPATSAESGDDEEETAGVKTPFGFDVEFQEGVARVSRIDRNSDAGRLGIRVGDQLVRVADRPVDDELTFVASLQTLREGDSVKVELQRDDTSRLLSITIPRSTANEIGGEIYRSDDGGQTWEKRNQQPIGGSPAYYYGQIRIDPQDDERVYVLSVPLYASSDGGREWSSIARSVHVDHHALWINPQNGRHIILGNDGGLHLSYDRGETWDYVFNLPLSQFYAIGVDMRQPYHVYGGLQDNGTWAGPSRSRDPSGIGRFEWHQVGGGDGFYAQIDPTDPNTYYAESQFGVIFRGDRRTGQRGSIRPPQSDPQGQPDRYNWNSPILISHHNPTTIYFAGNKLFKSYNRGDDWTVISPDLTTANPARIAGNVPHCTITTVAESPLDARVLLVGTDDGNVQWSNDGGGNWTNMADRFPIRPAGWWCTRVELSHHDINTAYVCFSAFREDDFRAFAFATHDRGETWQAIMGNLPQEPLNVLKEDAENANVLYAGTDFGVYLSLDRGKSWRNLEQQLPRVSVHDLVVHPREQDLVIGTHGRGIFILDDISAVQQWSDDVAGKAAHLFAPRDAVAFRRVSTQGISGDRKRTTPNPPYGAIISYHLKDNVEAAQLSLRVLDADGQEVRRLEPASEAGAHRVVWDLRRQGTGGGRGRGGFRGRGFGGATVEPGIYVIELKLGEETQRQMLQVLADEAE